MIKRIFFTLLLLHLLPHCAQAVIPPVKRLPALKTALFSTQLPTAITRQSFSQLLRATQLSTLNQAEKTLLLTHAFIREHHRFPRTIIYKEGKKISPEQCTQAQLEEMALGNKVGHLLRRNPTPEDKPIYAELLHLKEQFSIQNQYPYLLDALNQWIEHYHTWPREVIKRNQQPVDPTQYTPLEQEEIILAKQVNKLCQNPATSNLIDKELTEKIRQVRMYYDPNYRHPQEISNDDILELVEQIDRWFHTYHSGPNPYPLSKPVEEFSEQEREEYDLYLSIQRAKQLDPTKYPALFELEALQNKIREYTDITDTPVIPSRNLPSLHETTPIYPTPDLAEPPVISVTEANRIKTALAAWFKQYGTWPRKINKPIGKMSLLEMKEDQLARRIELLTERGLKHWLRTRTPSLEEIITIDLDAFLVQLENWVYQHNSMPDLWSNNIEEIYLAYQLEWIVRYTDPNSSEKKWLPTPNVKETEKILRRTTHTNPILTKIRSYYSQINP